MTTNAFAELWESPPPSDDAALAEWLLAREEETAAEVTRVLTRIVDDAYSAFLTTLTASGDMSAFDSIPPEWERYVTTDLGDRLGGMYASGSVNAWTQAPGTEALPVEAVRSWSRLQNDAAIDYIDKATSRLVGDVGPNIWNDVKNKVGAALQRGASTQELRDDIQAVTQFSARRAAMIARTEMNGAYVAGTYEGAASLGEYGPVEKYWIASPGPRTRPTHVAADTGIPIPFDQPFEVGGALMMRPHDPTGPAKEVVNCRCRVAFLYEGMTRPDGSVVTRATPGGQAPKPAAEPKPKRPRTIPKDGFKTSDDAVNYLKAKHPQVAWSDSIRSYDPRVATSIARWADDMAAKYPDQWAKMRYVGSQTEDGAFFEAIHRSLSQVGNYTWEDGVFAHAYMSEFLEQGVIGINPRYATDFDFFIREIGRMRKTGWMYGDSVEDILVHEFGHWFHSTLRREQTFGDLSTFYDKVFRGYKTGNVTTMESIFLKWQQAENRLSGSTYSTKNLKETFAESFLAVHKGLSVNQTLFKAYIDFNETLRQTWVSWGSPTTLTGAQTTKLRKLIVQLAPDPAIADAMRLLLKV